MKTEVFFYDPYAIYKYIWHLYYDKNSFVKGVVWAGNSEEAEKKVRESCTSENIKKIKMIKKDK